MANTYTLRIVSTEETLFDGQVESLIAPGTLGYLGVMANHAPLLSSLEKGVLKIRDDSGENRQFHIDSGILEVSNNEAIILTEKISET